MTFFKKYILLAIIMLAIFLRFWKLDSMPIGFNDDEAAFGYDAYSVLKTGRDEWAKVAFPTFESFGDWKLVGYLYPTVLSELFFGKNVFAVRFPSALIGVLAVISTYLLAKKLFDQKTALFAAFLLAINPWHIIASRNAFESDILIFTVSISVYFFLKGIEEKKYLLYSFLGFALSFYVYRSAWFFLPLFVSTIIFLHRNILQKHKTDLLKALIFAFFLLVPLLPTVLTFSGQSRFFQESFIYGVANQGIKNEINEKRGACFEHSKAFFCKMAYNKYLSNITTYVNNYFENLSSQTYFTKGPANGYQSFSNRGLFYDFELPLLLVGIVMLIVKKEKAAKILIPWILLVPLGASFTGVGNPGRLNIMLPAPQIIAAYGFFAMLTLLNKRRLKGAVIFSAAIIITISLVRLWTDMFYFYPKISGKYQRYGYQELFKFIASHKNDYNQIIISRKNDNAKQYIHYMFFGDIPPEKFSDSSFTTRYRGEDKWQVVEKIGNVHFYPAAPNLEDVEQKTLLVTEEHEVSYAQEPIHVVKYPNGDTAFELYDLDKVREKLKVTDDQL